MALQFNGLPETEGVEGTAQAVPYRRLLLFGRTGSGKSTVANMLVKGNLDEPLMFGVSDGLRGKTEKIQVEKGRGWEVVDTAGFGEIRHGTVTKQQARDRLLSFLIDYQREESYHHLVYVVRKDRMLPLDCKLWEFFIALFDVHKSDIWRNVLVLITEAKSEWLERNKADLERNFFPGCKHFLCVDFPPMDKEHEQMELRLAKRRQESLRVLQEKLHVLGGNSVIPQISKSHLQDAVDIFLGIASLPEACCLLFCGDDDECSSFPRCQKACCCFYWIMFIFARCVCCAPLLTVDKMKALKARRKLEPFLLPL